MEPTCPRIGPPNSWFEKFGLFTLNCGACKNVELSLPRSRKSHSAGCCRAYVEWLKEGRAKLGAGRPVVGEGRVDVRARGPVVGGPVPSSSAPGGAGQGGGEDVLPIPGSIFNDEESAPSDPVCDDAMGCRSFKHVWR